MDIAQKALYNSLRLSWLQDQSISVEPWKVEDYRALAIERLFARLQEKEIFVDRMIFKNYADQFDSPEELTEWLIDEDTFSPEEYDQMYLVIFELWRRLAPEKMSISILCDELDLQMYNYDQGEGDEKAIPLLQDALSNLYSMLEENVDRGMDPEEVFSAIAEFCAHNVERFLYDFIADRIDNEEYDYALELIEQFYPFVIDKKWFQLLNARLVNVQNMHEANVLIKKVFEENKKQPSLELSLDLLSTMVQGGNYQLFIEAMQHTLSLIETEEDFVELLHITADFFRCLDREDIQQKIESIIQKRASNSPQGQIIQNDSDVAQFTQLVKV
jgi:hypothetical protein